MHSPDCSLPCGSGTSTIAQGKPTLSPILLERSPSAPAAAAQPSDIVGQLERLAALRDRCVLTDEAFESQKAKLLE